MAAFDKDAFAAITGKTHTEQAIWYLNGFWTEGAEAQAEEVWNICHLFIETQIDRPKRYGRKTDEVEEEADLEEHKAHRLLELMGETQTVLALRKRLSALDIDNNHRMALTEFLLDRYQKTPQQVIDAPQGNVDPAKLEAAQAALDAAASAYAHAQDEAKAASAALEESKQAAADAEVAKQAADDASAKAHAAADKVRAAEAELQAAIDEISRLEEEKATKIAKFQAIIDSDAGVVKKGQAVAQKEALLSEDPMPLRKAKITQAAALKKVTKARTLAEEEEAAAKTAAEQAADAKKAADEAAVAAAAAKEAADAAEVAAQQALAEANEQLEALKSAGGTPYGKIWWMERTLTEKKKFMK